MSRNSQHVLKIQSPQTRIEYRINMFRLLEKRKKITISKQLTNVIYENIKYLLVYTMSGGGDPVFVENGAAASMCAGKSEKRRTPN